MTLLQHCCHGSLHHVLMSSGVFGIPPPFKNMNIGFHKLLDVFQYGLINELADAIGCTDDTKCMNRILEWCRATIISCAWAKQDRH